MKTFETVRQIFFKTTGNAWKYIGTKARAQTNFMKDIPSFTKIGHCLIEKSIISRSAKDTALSSMIELSLGYYGYHKRKNNGIVHEFQMHFKSSLFIQLTCN